MTSCSLPSKPRDDDAVVVAVGDEQAVAGFVGQDFARESAAAFARLCDCSKSKWSGCSFEHAFLAIVGQRFLHECDRALEIDFAAAFGDEIAFRIDHPQAGPTAAVVSVPDLVVGVVDHRMLDFVAQDGLADVLGVVLGVELGGVDADDHHVVRIRVLELFQLRQDVHAVDAAVGPEIEDDEFAAQGVEIDRLVGIEPLRCRLPMRGPATWRGKGCSAAEPSPDRRAAGVAAAV